MSRTRGSLDGSGGLCPRTVVTVPGACSWILWWRGQRLGLLVGVLAVVTPTRVFGAHVGVSCSLRVCVRGRKLCGGPAPPLCAPSNGTLPLAGPGFFPVHLSGRSPASSGRLCAAKRDPAPESDLRCPGIKHEAPAHTCGQASEAGQCRVAVPTAVQATPLCLLPAGSCALLWGSKAPPVPSPVSPPVRGLPRRRASAPPQPLHGCGSPFTSVQFVCFFSFLLLGYVEVFLRFWKSEVFCLAFSRCSV